MSSGDPSIAAAIARNLAAAERERQRNRGDRLEIRTTGAHGFVAFNGQDISAGVKAIRVSAEANQLPRIVIELAAPDLTLGSDQVQINLPSATRDALIALGWTPPADGAE